MDSTLKRDGLAFRGRFGLGKSGKIPPRPPTATVKAKHRRARTEGAGCCASRGDGADGRSDRGWNGTPKSGGFAAGQLSPQMDEEEAAALLEKLVLETSVMPLGRRPLSSGVAPSSLEGNRGGFDADWAVGNDDAEEEAEEEAALAAAVAAALAWTPTESAKEEMLGECHQGPEETPASRCDSGREDVSDDNSGDSHGGNGTTYRSDRVSSRYGDRDVDTAPSQDGMTRGVGCVTVSGHVDTTKPRPGSDYAEYGLGGVSPEPDSKRCLSPHNCDDGTEREIAETPQTSAPSPVDSGVDVGSAWPDKAAISMIAEIGGSCSSDITAALTVGEDSKHSNTADGQHELSIAPQPKRLLVHQRSSTRSITSNSTAASDTRRQYESCQPKCLNAAACDPTDSAATAYDSGAPDSDGAPESPVKLLQKRRNILKAVDAHVSISLCPRCAAEHDSTQRRATTGWHQRASCARSIGDGCTAVAAIDAESDLGSDADGGNGGWSARAGRLSLDALTQKQHMKHLLAALDQQEPYEQGSDDESEEYDYSSGEEVAIRVGVRTGAGSGGIVRGGLGENVPRDMAAIPYSRLRGPGRQLPRRVHPAKREEWLSAAEFLEAFGISYRSFRQLPFWRRVLLKQRAELF